MRWGISHLEELREMKEKMDRAWNTLFEESPISKEQEIWQWIEKFQKFEGTEGMSFKSRSNKTIRF
jgi:hypothetical protein